MNSSAYSDCRDLATTSDTVELVASIVYGSASLVLYYLEARVILRNKKFSHPFFYQFIYLAVLNVIFWLMVFVKQRIIPFPMFCSLFYPRFIQPSLLLHPIMLINFTILVAQELCVIIITLNRMTVILWPQEAEIFWMKNWGKVLIFSFLLACICESHTFPIPVSVNVKGGRLSTIFNTDVVWPYITPVYSVSIASFLCLVVVFPCTVISLLALRRKKILARMKSAQINMFWTSFSFSVPISFVMLYMVAQSLFSSNPDVIEFLYSVRGWMYDLNCLSPSWMLLLTNRRIRSALLGTTTVICPPAIGRNRTPTQ